MKDRFFTKLDWAAFWTATVATFAVYFLTLGPSVGLEDSGELATAAANLGVPHPPGYPFWTFCSWLFCKAFFWVTYMGHPTPAWAVSLCSALFGAFAAGCTAMLICRSAGDFVGGEATDGGAGATRIEPPSPLASLGGCPEPLPAGGGSLSGVFGPLPKVGAGSWLCFGGGVGGALTFAFSPVEWSQSTIVEIYSLNALFLMWVFLLSYRWMRKPSDKILWFTAFVFGLGLTNYQVLLFAIVPLAIIIAVNNIGLFRDVFIYLVPVGLTWQLLQIGQLMRADRNMQADVINKHEAIVGRSVSTPSTTVLVIAVSVLVASVVAAVVLKKRGDRGRAEKAVLYGGFGGAALMMLCSFVFVSKNTWSGVTAPVAPLVEPTRYALIAALVAGSVAAAAVAALRDDEKLSSPFSAKFLGASAVFAVAAVVAAATVPSAGDGGYAGEPFPWAKSTFVFWLLIVLLFVLCAFTRKGLCLAVPAAGLHIAAFTLLTHGAMNGLTHPMSWWFGWPIAWNFVLLALVWATLPNGRSVAGAAFFAQLGVSFYAYMPIVSDLRNPPMNWGYPRTWEGFKHAIMRGQYEAIAFQMPTWGGIKNYLGDVMVQFTDLLIPFALVPFAAGHWLVARANRKAFWRWMIAAAACFFMMSVLLIGLANVKGDVQDGFIQKVKFISSHAMIALWIGYGLVFTSVLILRKWFAGDGRVALALAAAMILVCGIYPIVQNYTDDRLVFELGGAEQNGHTFGWQFGAYQLEGAQAIREQLVADEEPLPDPTWPPPMDKFSIFFGGTDPGRFVPTYMIYSALFRPDVYLITQNALADDTYMSVERDLYGDEIWIPSKEDSAQAFNQYVDEVQRGVRPPNGDLKIENGRVQVTGALGVMEINGILTKMMHDHDRLRHAFYVEESYVIPWMYPYLSPHGLIMKINPDPTPYDAARAAKDMDFWDWYFRRLLDDPMYRRDFAGQKSFSKLRAAIAGLYQRQGRYREAGQAFREAVLLYPASPEATFRYAQEILMPFRKWDVTLELMAYTDAIDPNNKRTEGLKRYIFRLRALTSEMERLEAKRRAGGLNGEETLALARCFFEMGRVMEAAQLARGVADGITDPGQLRNVSLMFIEARLDADAEKALNRYLKFRPREDANAWADLAKLQHRAGRRQAAQQSFIQGYQIDRQMLYQRLQKDQELYEIAAPLFRQRQ
ncbi:MAG: DUF2723 domain-containing protein [Kiritimatiellae bacterium]|nr:DUF2723 domain-containing protein [Kiritimatiellia bacterium]